MISERTFAGYYTSFWRRTCPLTRKFVTRANLTVEHYISPLESAVEKDRRSLVSEIAYRNCLAFLDPSRLKKRRITHKAEKEVLSAAFEGASRFLNSVSSQEKLTLVEENEVKSLRERLLAFLLRFYEGSSYVANPRFPGCGILGACAGDMIVGKCLFEVKTISDNFHAPDFRQVIIYLTLNHLSHMYDLETVALVNPLRGVYFKSEVEDLVISVSGYQPLLLYEEITQFLTTERDFMHLKRF